MGKRKTSYLLLVLLLMGILASPVLAASTIKLTKGQTLRIDPDGKVTVVKMDMGVKMQETMKKLAQPATKGLRVWFDQNGQLTYLTDPEALTKEISGDGMDKMKEMKH